MNDILRLVEPLVPALRRYARALLHDATAADDLVQDCLERVISRWHQRRGDDEARAWVFAILHNLAVNRLRQTARRGAHLPLEDADSTALALAPTQEDVLMGRDIVDAVAMLPEDQRSVLLLVTVEDLSYSQAAEVLGIPIGTVMSRLARGRERLRQILGGEGGAVAPPGSHLRRIK